MDNIRSYANVEEAYNEQIGQLPEALRLRECCLIQIGLRHAQDFDKGHEPSGGGVQRVLAELRKLHEAWTQQTPPDQPVSDLDAVRAKRNNRLSQSTDMQRPPVGDNSGA